MTDLERTDEHMERLARLDPAPLDRVEAETTPGDREAARERAITLASGAETPRVRSRRGPLRIAALAGMGAVVLLIVGLARGDGDSTGGDSFGSYAALAAEQPADGLRYVSWESRLLYDRPEHWAQGARYPDEIDDSTEVRLWLSDEQRFEQDVHRFWDGTDMVVRSTYLLDSPSSIACWGGFEGMPDGSCASSGIVGELGDPADRYDLPLEPDALRDALKRVLREQGMAAEAPGQTCATEGQEFGMPVPYSLVGAADRSTLITDLRAAAGLEEDEGGWTYRPPPEERMFTLITSLLADPQAEPELRAALFEVLAGIDGAELAPDGEDRLGRPASVIEYEAPPDERVAHDQVFVDPETSEVLEQRTTVEEIDGSAEPEVLGTYYRLFTERGEADALPAASEPFQGALREAQRNCEPARR